MDSLGNIQMQDGPFDLDITPEQAGAIAFVVNSPAYLTVYKPLIQGMVRSLIEDLLDPSRQRKWDKPDDYLRGAVITARALLSFPENVLEELRSREESDRKVRAEDQHYADRAAEGRIGPMGFDYKPEEDF